MKVVDSMYVDSTDSTVIVLQGATILGGSHYLLTNDGVKHRITGCNFLQVELYKKNRIMVQVDGRFDYSEAEFA
ncbi:MAG: head protein [Lactobacillus delbrueckii]|nr:head protein [Lactobacillus delbrueckii]